MLDQYDIQFWQVCRWLDLQNSKRSPAIQELPCVIPRSAPASIYHFCNDLNSRTAAAESFYKFTRYLRRYCAFGAF